MKCKSVVLRTSFFTSFWFKVLTPVGDLVQNLSRPGLLNPTRYNCRNPILQKLHSTGRARENSLWFRFPLHPGPEERHGDAKDDVHGAHVVGESEEPHNQVQLWLRLKIVLFLLLLLFIFTGLLIVRFVLDGVEIVAAEPSAIIRLNLQSEL